MQTCAHCATPIPDDARFCHSCGSQVSDAEGQAAATAAMDNAAFLHMEALLREDMQGEFAIEEMLGRGGMAVVYLATEIHLSRKVAIKVLPPELTFGHGVERFKREAKTAAALDHPNIIPIYRIASGGKLFWYAMKYLEGDSLDRLLRAREQFEIGETINILTQVADALDYAHEHSVIHRDIKPANVMLDRRGRVTVTDFGIAKALTEGTLTASGSVIGTPYYMSPEQGMGKPVTGKADQYSVAVMAYRMLSGQVPFEGDSAIDILHKHCMVPPPPLETVRPGLPRHVYLAIHKGLEKEAGRRFRTVSELVRGLERPLEQLHVPGERTSESEVATMVVSAPPDTSGADRGSRVASPAKPAAPTPTVRITPPRRTWRWLWAAIVVLAGGVGGWIALQRGTAPGAGPATDQVQQPDAAAANDSANRGGAQESVPPAPTTGTITVTGLPSGGTIFWNGERQEASFEVPPGTHTVELRADGYEVQRSRIEVAAGVQLALPFVASRRQVARPPAARPTRAPPRQRPPAAPQPSTALLRIGVQPAARLFIDGESLGERRVFQREVAAGIAHQIRLVRDGYRTRDTTVTVGPGDTVVIRIRLERNQ